MTTERYLAGLVWGWVAVAVLLGILLLNGGLR